jgi:hypothetical protein
MIKESIKLLKERGHLSSTFLMRKLKVTYSEAQKILSDIANEYNNVNHETKNFIYLCGRQELRVSPMHVNHCAKPKKEPKKRSKVLKWKDITKA